MLHALCFADVAAVACGMCKYLPMLALDPPLSYYASVAGGIQQ